MQLKLKDHNEDLIKLIEKTLETNNTKGAREHIDTAINKPNNNLTCYHNGRFWDVPEKFVFLQSMLLKYG